MINLEAKLASRAFRVDISALTNTLPQEYIIDAAAELVIDRLLSKV